jgi:hypothetical protein
MERGSDKHGPRHDEALDKELQGMLGQAGGHREEWLDPELDDSAELDADADTAAEGGAEGAERGPASG